MEFIIDEFPGRSFTKDHKELLYFGGTAYLGLQTLPEFQDILIQNIKKYGTTYSASRKSNVKLEVYEKLEYALKKFTGATACTTLSSGYMASQLVSNYIKGQHIHAFFAPHTHPALHYITANNYLDYVTFIRDVNQYINNHPSEEICIFCDSIDFNGKNYPNFFWLEEIQEKQNIILVIDDSHGIGIIGEHGNGIFPLITPTIFKDVIICGSLGKGFAIQGGAIWGSEEIINELTATPFFAGASPITPAMASTFLESATIYQQQFKKLRANIQLFLENTILEWFDGYMPDFPAFTFYDEQLLNTLLKHQIIPTSFRYPFKDSPLTNRIVISAHHTNDDILKLSQIIANKKGTL
ncbi:aminotransferase class I/II-fold pyridoxal phosphate-dependent enzyme [Zhouia sp. PK063]|uniref:aminotransferase class I/II-fold pyridoxal phosphate-dependent enzyme n=1 Tax=Zhouia sp. PK063 TaxID=3373602 RepID=UPI003789932C